MVHSICHCPGVAAGSPETCTHVILIPESHNLALVFAGRVYTLLIILTYIHFNLVLTFPLTTCLFVPMKIQ